MPTSTKFDGYIANMLMNVDVAIVIRTGDKLPLMDRFCVPKSRLAFLKLPIAGQLPSIQNIVEPYIFSGGTAHRDWVTFCNALDGLPMKAKVITNTTLSTLGCKVPQNIEELGLLSQAKSRKVMEFSKLVCLSFQDTLLPSGPLVLLDAMAAGKAVVATECNGTRDYLTQRHNGILFPPKDHTSLRKELLGLHDDFDFRRQLGKNARQTIIDEHMPQHFYKNLFNILNIG
jgi:glycosyltransferase involved in cell wall biosynthesis